MALRGASRFQQDRQFFANPIFYLAVGLVLIAAFAAGDYVGKSRATPKKIAAEVETFDPVGQDFAQFPLAEVSEAIQLIRVGQVEEAREVLESLPAESGTPRGVAFLRALSYLQEGDLDQAERKVQIGLSRGERISDSLALQAAIESARAAEPNSTRLVDPRERAKNLLQAAILADPLNPSPFVELAAHARLERNPELAREYLLAAKNRMNAVDAATAVSVTLALLEAEQGSLDEVLAGLPQPSASQAFLSALAAHRAENTALVEENLRLARNLVGLETFVYLMGDAALREISYPTELGVSEE
jgi:tetratricopeptide (TPR) repeat protein